MCNKIIEWGIFSYNKIRLPQSTLSENVLDITFSEYSTRWLRLSKTNIKKNPVKCILYYIPPGKRRLEYLHGKLYE